MRFRNLIFGYFILAMLIGYPHFPLFGQASTLQESNYSLIKTIDVESDLFSTDYLGHVYVVVDDQLLKYNMNGLLLRTYSNKSLGSISMIDASNPLRILLFYQDFSQLVFLDDMLALIGAPILLEDLGLDQAVMACTSINDGIWLFDPQDVKLTRLDRNLNVSQTAYHINQLTGVNIEPSFLLEQDNFLYLNNPETGILVFDIFGTYLKTIPVKIPREFQVIDGKLFYFNNGSCHSYDFVLFKTIQYPIPVLKEDVIHVRIEKGKQLLAVQKETRIELLIIED